MPRCDTNFCRSSRSRIAVRRRRTSTARVDSSTLELCPGRQVDETRTDNKGCGVQPCESSYLSGRRNRSTIPPSRKNPETVTLPHRSQRAPKSPGVRQLRPSSISSVSLRSTLRSRRCERRPQERREPEPPTVRLITNPRGGNSGGFCSRRMGFQTGCRGRYGFRSGGVDSGMQVHSGYPD